MQISRGHLSRGLAAAAVTACIIASPLTAFGATSTDYDGDGMPNTWEKTYKLEWRSAADATKDADGDGLTNLAEFRQKANPRDEDTDNDGEDDGDEVAIGTQVLKADSDGDKVLDGDEDADGDGIANEDEDDATETCTADDDDVDHDYVADEDENEEHLVVGSFDSDRDHVFDGSEDADGDGTVNKDEDDATNDACAQDKDGNGVDDENEQPRQLKPAVGKVTGWDAATGTLSVQSFAGARATWKVTEKSEIELVTRGGEIKGTAGISVGVNVVEYELGVGDVVKEISLRM